MQTAPFEDLLKRAIGLNPVSVGAHAIPRAVYRRMAAHKLTSDAEYLALVSGKRSELQALIDAVVVPETWFFRHPQAFAQVARRVTASRPASGAAKVRILSLPCSSGEEPFSMAMALLDAGVAADRFAIDAIDVSEHSLALARRAVYGRNSFRGTELAFRDRHFEAAESRYRLKDASRGPVTFALGNLLTPYFLTGVEPYDVVFCRNLLIYFDSATQHRAIEVLSRLLAPDGELFVGPAEANLMLAHGFAWSKVPLAFSFLRATEAVPPAPAVRVVERWEPVAQPRRPAPPAQPRRPAPPAQPRRPASPAQSVQSGSDNALAAVQQLADLGQLVEAARSCDAHLSVYGPSARAFHLRALIYSAAERPDEAVASLRKALYLEPDLREALVHLALLLEKGGDAEAAVLLRARVGRLNVNDGERAP